MPEVDQWLNELMRINDEEEKMTEKQMKIVQAAVDIFAEKGYSASSTSEIAQKAGVAEGTIFRHYKTKKELLLSIVAPMMTKLVAPFAMKDFNKILEAEYKEMEDFLRAVIRNRLEFARKNFPVIKILLHEIPFQAELKAQFKEIIAIKVLEKITKVMIHFQRDGKIIDIPPTTAIRLTTTTIIGYLLVRFLFLPEKDWDDEQEIEYTVDFIMHGLAPRP
jgi:AcrR family transcriptional regulator